MNIGGQIFVIAQNGTSALEGTGGTIAVSMTGNSTVGNPLGVMAIRPYVAK